LQPRGKQVAGVGWQEGWLDTDAPTVLADFLQVLDGAPDHSAYVGNRMEGAEHQNNPFWTPAVHTATWGTQDAAGLAVER
ncbi:hypothetical protein ACC706_38300, partial [Rhizobium johnstonii]